MNPWLVCILLIIFVHYVLEVSVALLNLKALSPQLPEEFARETTQDEYAKSQEYTRITTYVSLIENTWSTVLTLIFLLSGGFNLVDIWARGFGFGTIPTGLLYMGVLLLLLMLIGLPFSLYSTFVIENRFGFNKTTIKTFLLDLNLLELVRYIHLNPLRIGVVADYAGLRRHRIRSIKY
jgi:STE24 endopeptidase